MMINHANCRSRSRDTTAPGGGATAAELCPFPAETSFGQYIRPLFDALNAIASERSIESYREEANALANFYRPAGIAVSGIRDIELTEADQKFMMGHPVGDTIRRVHLHYWLAETFSEAVKRYQILEGMPAEAQGQIERFCDIVRRYGFSQYIVRKPSVITSEAFKAVGFVGGAFLGDDQGIVVSKTDRSFLSDGLADLPLSNLQVVIHDVRQTCASLTLKLVPAYEKLKDLGLSVITDPYHMWQALALNLRPLLVSTSLAKDLVELMGQQVLLVIEDNQAYHAMYRPFFELESISFFGPQGIEGSTSNRERIFTECEAAIKLLRDALETRSPVPSVLIIDIELGPNGMNGLEFLKQAHDLYTRYGRRNEVILACATSSNLSLYQEQINALKQAGTIDCGYRKTDFSPEDLARIIAEHAQR